MLKKIIQQKTFVSNTSEGLDMKINEFLQDTDPDDILDHLVTVYPSELDEAKDLFFGYIRYYTKIETKRDWRNFGV